MSVAIFVIFIDHIDHSCKVEDPGEKRLRDGVRGAV